MSAVYPPLAGVRSLDHIDVSQRMRAFAKELKQEWLPSKKASLRVARHRDAFETASERNLASFLKPFGLDSFNDTVWKLARDGGFLNAEALHFVDDAALYRLSIADTDRPLVLLAAWLHLQQLHEYGPALVGNGFVSLAKLKGCTDEAMKRSGMRLMGHRRLLLRQIREDLALRTDLDDAPKANLFSAAAFDTGSSTGVRRTGTYPTPFHLGAL